MMKLGPVLTPKKPTYLLNNEEIKKLISIDINGPTGRSIDHQAATTAWALNTFLDYETLPESKVPCYTYDEMIKLLLDAYDTAL